METSSGLLVLVLALVGLAAGCGPRCDEAGLLRAKQALVAGGPHARREGVAALAEACPGLPRSLSQGLVGAEGSFAEAPITRAEEPRWWELLVRTCPRFVDEDDDSMLFAQLDQVLRGECDLEPHGLLAADELFMGRDVVVFMLHEWLVGRRVDRGLAAEVARPFLASHALAGSRPPRGTIDLPLRGGPAIRVSATTVSVDDTALALPVAGAFTEHVSPRLLDALVTRVRALQAGRARHQWDMRTMLVVDSETPFSIFADTLFTATRAGFDGLEIVVSDGQQMMGQPIGVPAVWVELEPGGFKYEGMLEVLFAVHVDALELRLAGGAWKTLARPTTCEPPPAACHDIAAVAKLMASLKQEYPNETVVQFIVDGDVSVQTVVSLIDAARGEGCRLRGASMGEAVPKECLFFQPVVDLAPGLRFEPAP